MKYLIDHSDGLSKDIMLGKLMDEYLENGQIKGVKKYLNKIGDEAIKNLIKSRIKELEIDN